jgi:type II secretory pathway pseudopilin PulG
VIARFEAERQALALMDHPNISKVFDAGTTVTGRPFFVMELVRGIKITEYCDQNRLSTRERLELAVQVCHAIQHAHQKGIIANDLDWIVMKCLQKDRTRRYETANGLAADIEHHLSHEPVVARPPSTVYRVQKFVRRNKVMVTAASMVVLALVLGIVTSTWLAFGERQQRQRAEVSEQIALQAQAEEARQRQATRDLLYTANVRLAKEAWQAGSYRRFERLVEDTRAQPGKGFEWHFLNRQRHAWVNRFQAQPSVGLEWLAFYPDGSRLVVTGQKGFARVYAFPSTSERLPAPSHRAETGWPLGPLMGV